MTEEWNGGDSNIPIKRRSNHSGLGRDEGKLLASQEISKRKVGLFGGTFNPIHLGHLRGAEEVREVCGLKQVIFIPAAQPPHKMMEEVIDARHRLEMVRLATMTNPFFSYSDVELQRPGKSYSIDTLRYFLEHGRDSLLFILGRDAFDEMETWKEFQNLFSLCDFVVMARPGFGKIAVGSQLPQALASTFQYDSGQRCWIHTSGHRLFFEEINFLDISSTRVRELIEKGASVKYLVPSEVEVYIRQQKLYQKRA